MSAEYFLIRKYRPKNYFAEKEFDVFSRFGGYTEVVPMRNTTEIGKDIDKIEKNSKQYSSLIERYLRLFDPKKPIKKPTKELQKDKTKERNANRNINERTGRQKDGRMDKQIDRDRPTSRPTDRQAFTQTDRQTQRQADTQKDRQTYRQVGSKPASKPDRVTDGHVIRKKVAYTSFGGVC